MRRLSCTAIAGFLMVAFAAIAPFTFAQAEEAPPHVVFLTGEDRDNYEAHRTIPIFAEWLEAEHGFKTTVLHGEGPLEAHRLPDVSPIEEADVLVIFFRRRAFPTEQLNVIKSYLKEGKPLVGIRTANHAFCVREDAGDGIAEGHEAWWEFVPEILGCENRGYGPSEPGTAVSPAPGMEDHPIFEGVEPLAWHSTGNVYIVAPLVDEEAEVLLHGTVEDRVEPIAWTRRTDDGSPVFYTSLGHPSDFEVPQFRTLLLNGIQWSLEQATP